MTPTHQDLAAELEGAPQVAEPANDGGEPPDGPPPPQDADSGDYGGRPRGQIFEGCQVKALGVFEDISFYLDTLGQLRAIDNHSLDKIRHLFGGDINTLAYHFPQYDKDGNCRPMKFDQAMAAAVMTQAAAECGVWKPTGKVRGAGCWTDEEGGLIIHAGDRILINRQWVEPGVHGGKVYSAGDAVPRPADRKPRYDATGELLSLIATWNWRRPDVDPTLALGLIMAQILGGALEWRPVAWLSGSKATGKSTFQKLLHYVHGGEAGLLQAADATEGGIRSVIGYTSLPVAIDELEPDADNPRKVKAVIELARRAASGAQIFRGSADQKGHQSNAYSCFLFSSILVPPLPAQDRSRLILLELDALPGGTPKLTLDPRKLRTIGSVLRRRIIDGWDTWPARLDAWRAALAEEGQEGRAGDNYATVLALADMALSDTIASSAVMASMCAKVSRAIASDEMEIGDDAEDMALHLMGQFYDPFRRGEQYTVAQWVMAAAELRGAPKELFNPHGAAMDKSEDVRKANGMLAKIGLRVKGREGDAQIFFPRRPIPQLCAMFDGSPWANGVWYQSAMRMKGAERNPSAVKLAGIESRGVYVPLTSIAGISDFQTTQDFGAVAPSAPPVRGQSADDPDNPW